MSLHTVFSWSPQGCPSRTAILVRESLETPLSSAIVNTNPVTATKSKAQMVCQVYKYRVTDHAVSEKE